MNNMHIGIMGIMAGICTTASFIPQIVKIVKTKHVRDISLQMYVVLTTGIFLWIIYGIFLGELPIILANCVAFVLCSYVIIAKVLYGKNQ